MSTQQEFATPEISVGAKVREKTAIYAGQSLRTAIHILKTDVPLSQKKQDLDQLFSDLPPHLQTLFRQGRDKFEKETSLNHQLLVEHDGHLEDFLMETLYFWAGETYEEKQSLASSDHKPQAKEIYPGVVIFEVSNELEKKLIQRGILDTNARANFFRGNGIDRPSFIVSTPSVPETTITHELSHLVTYYLFTGGDYLRETEESTLELNGSLFFFRDEIIAYLVSDCSFDEFDISLLTYSEDQETLELANNAQDMASLCIDITRNLGQDPVKFVYACITARTFQEFIDKFTELVTIKSSSSDELYAVYSAWYKNRTSTLRALLQKKQIRFSTSTIPSLYPQLIPAQTELRYLPRKINELGEFCQAINLDCSDPEDSYAQIVRQRLALPRATQDLILNWPNRIMSHVLLDTGPDDFLTKLINPFCLDNSDYEEERDFYQAVVDSDPEMKTALGRVYQKIVDNQEEYIFPTFNHNESDRRDKLHSRMCNYAQMLKRMAGIPD